MTSDAGVQSSGEELALPVAVHYGTERMRSPRSGGLIIAEAGRIPFDCVDVCPWNVWGGCFQCVRQLKRNPLSSEWARYLETHLEFPVSVLFILRKVIQSRPSVLIHRSFLFVVQKPLLWFRCGFSVFCTQWVVQSAACSVRSGWR